MKEKLPSPSPLLRPGLAEFLQVFHEDLVLEWERTLLARSPADWPHETLLREHLPGFLEQLAEALESPPSATRPPWPQAVPDEHALRCLEAGMSSERIALEFSLLRHCIHQGLVREGIEAGPAEWELLNESIDQGLIRVTALHANVRERMLKALERVSEVALESLEIDTFLNRLLRVLQEAAVSVDGASILLCEEEALRLRASVGLDSRQAVKADLHLTLDEGLSGEVVRGRGPHLVRMAAQHPAPRSDLVRQLGVRAIYSVPLRHGERLIGLAHMSSSTLFDFTPSDKLLFRAMMTRATSFLLRAELVEQEQKARAKAQRLLAVLDTLVETCPVGISHLDRELRFLCINDTLALLHGQPVEAHLGRALHDFAPPWLLEHLEPRLRWVLEREEALSDQEVIGPAKPGGSPRNWLGHYYPVRTPEGVLEGVGCVFVDITQQKRVEAELRQAGEVRERLIGVVGHDLRNPLHAIQASVTLLRRKVGEESLRVVERIHSSAARMTRMINDILDFARGSANGGLPVYRERVDLHALCRSALEELQLSHADRRLELETRGDGWGWWDADRLTQVVGNLVGNALQHGHADTAVRVEVRDDGEHVSLSVHNEGEPIAPELLPNLFEPFRHGVQSRGPSSSVGLGLYIVQQVARAHGGDATVESDARGHTVFTVRLPRNG